MIAVFMIMGTLAALCTSKQASLQFNLLMIFLSFSFYGVAIWLKFLFGDQK